MKDNYFNSKALGSSAISCLLKSPPAMFKARHIDKTAELSTTALTIGSAVHCAILERLDFNARYMCLPPEIKQRRGKAYEAFLLENPNVEILTASDYKMCSDMQDSVDNSGIDILLGAVEVEKEIFWEEDGVECRGKIDALCQYGGEPVMVDIKTTKSADPFEFAKSMYNFGYATQAAHYYAGAKHNGIDIKKCFLLAIEKTKPYLCALYEISSDAMIKGEEDRQKALSIYRYCNENNEWSGYAGGVIDLPTFAYNK